MIVIVVLLTLAVAGLLTLLGAHAEGTLVVAAACFIPASHAFARGDLGWGVFMAVVGLLVLAYLAKQAVVGGGSR